jgi:hypothetical protein
MINQNWVFGKNAGLDFSTSTPTPTSSNVINTFEGCACISNASGNLLLYTDGQRVWDGTNTQRAMNLLGNPSSTQSAIIVPDPANAAQYYVFTADGASGGNNHVNGIRIDTSTSTWGITQLSSIMTMPPTAGFSPTEKLTAIQHKNCKDYWVLTIIQPWQTGQPQPANGLGTLRVFLVNSTGVQHVGDTPMNVTINDLGYLKGSPDGGRIAIANWSNSNVLVYPFDNSTGTIDLSNLLTIPVPAISVQNHVRNTYGVEFSPNSDILYYTVLGSPNTTTPQSNGYVFQQDLTVSSASVQVGMHPNAGGPPSRYALGALQLGIDGRIYMAQDAENALGVIANPDVLGAGCNLTFSAVLLAPGTTCYLGLPNLIPNPCGCACDEGNCDEAVDRANQILNTRADDKFFTIIANGQTVPPNCGLAFQQTNFEPIFSLHWGDGTTDQFESHDTEIIYISIRNPFRNLIYRGVKIFNIRITPNQVLPSGEDALELIPAEIACFDEIEPCSYVSRDFAFLIQNAVVQGYQITFDYCIEETAIVSPNDGSASFNIQVVAS